MNKLIIEASLTDEQIAIIADGLGYKQTIIDWERQVEWELVAEIDEETWEEILVPSTLTEPNVIPNTETDDEFVRNFFEKMIGETSSSIFARETIAIMEKQKEEALAWISAQINWAITSKKQETS